MTFDFGNHIYSTDNYVFRENIDDYGCIETSELILYLPDFYAKIEIYASDTDVFLTQLREAIKSNYLRWNLPASGNEQNYKKDNRHE